MIETLMLSWILSIASEVHTEKQDFESKEMCLIGMGAAMASGKERGLELASDLFRAENGSYSAIMYWPKHQELVIVSCEEIFDET